MLKIIFSDPGATLVDYGFEMYIISTSNNKSVLGALPVENLEELDHVIDEGNIFRI